MREEEEEGEEQLTSHHQQKSCWSKLIARKWLSSFKSQDGIDHIGRVGAERRKSCSDRNFYAVVPDDDFSDDEGLHSKNEEQTATNDSHNLKVFVWTWNVGGKSPPNDLNLQTFLINSAADIYVLGFQEIVPLNAGNVLGSEDSSPAAEWLSLIRHTLNTPRQEEEDLNSTHNDFETFHTSGLADQPPRGGADTLKRQLKYFLAASKQMVGLFLCVWVRSDLVAKLGDIKVSCVGRGIMGYLGNKGSVSISMTLCNTSFCVVCTHLASGEKEGNEARRNLDVLEILRKTRFGRPFGDGILDHDNVIWLGDLNYRLGCDRAEICELVKQKDWQALLEKDQLKMEQRTGRVFKGWNEGVIAFGPTYKYLPDSDQYVIHSKTSFKEKARSPAWCDRILWKGDGLKQMKYDRDENKFSDHRPVYSIFTLRVDKHRKFTTMPIADPMKSATLNSASCAARIRAEELFMLTRAQSCIRPNTKID